MIVKDLLILSLHAILLMISTEAVSQIIQPKRIEFEIKEFEDYHSLIPAEEGGLLLYRESEETGEKDKKKWEFVSIDTALDVRWTKLFDIDIDYKILGYAYSDEQVYFLFRDGYSNRDNFVVITMGIVSADTTHHYVKKLIPLDHLTHFEVVGQNVLIGGMINNRPTLIHHDLLAKKSKVIPGIYKGESEILELKTDQQTKTFNVLITEKLLDKRFTMTLMSFNESGLLLFNTKLEPEREKSLIFAGSTPFKEDEIMVTGTYSHKRSTHSRGVFIASIDALGNQNIAYYNYADLENFFNYMKAGREARVKKRIERKKIRGKKIKLTYRLLVRDIVEMDDHYVMVGEAFYPSYGTDVSNGAYSYHDSYQMSGGQNFVGYKFTHAIVIGFNAQGEVLWDNSFEINDVERLTLDPVINLGVEDNKIVLLYLYEDEIRSKIIKNDEVVEGKSSDEIKLCNENDVVKSTRDEYGGLSKWYGKYFYAYGIQRIKNEESNPLGYGKEVFFINKVTYE